MENEIAQFGREWFEDGYHALLDAILSDDQVERAAKALASHWHGPNHPCMKDPCDDCLEDARRCIEGAIPLGQPPIDQAYESAKATRETKKSTPRERDDNCELEGQIAERKRRSPGFAKLVEEKKR